MNTLENQNIRDKLLNSEKNIFFLENEVFNADDFSKDFVKVDFTNETCLPPYHPFFNIIKDYFTNIKSSEIYKVLKKNVYSCHIDIFYSFIKNLEIKRDEEVLLEELDFEIKLMCNSIVNLLNYISKDRHIYIHFINYQQVTEDTEKIVNLLTKEKFNSEIIIVCSNSEIDKNNQKISTKYNLTERLYNIELYYQFLSLKECYIKSTTLYDELILNGYEIDLEDKFMLIKTIGDIYLLNEDFDAALISYNILLSLSQQMNSDIHIATAYRKLSHSHLLKDNPDDAINYGELAYKLATRSNNKTCIALTAFLNFKLHSYVSAYAKHFIHIYETSYLSLFASLEEVKFYNYLSFIYTNGNFLISLLKFSNLAPYASEYFNTGIKYAKKNANIYRLSEAYNSEGIMLQATKDREKALISYKKAFTYKKTIGKSRDISKLTNGIGYFYFTEGDYKSASKYFNKSLSYLKNSKYYEEICSTYFNFAAMNFFTFNYDCALKYYSAMLDIMDPLEIDDLPYHSRITIYSLLGICNLKIDNYPIALKFYTKIKLLPLFVEDNHDFEYFTLFSGLFQKYRGNYSDAKQLLLEAANIQRDKNLDEPYFSINVLYELGDLANLNQNRIEAQIMWNKAFSLCTTNSFPFMFQLLNNLINDKDVIKNLPYKTRNFELKSVTELVKLDNNLNELHKKVEEISFLNSLQDLLRDKNTGDNIIQYSTELITNNFLLDTVIVTSNDGGKFKILNIIYPDSSSDTDETKKNIEVIITNLEHTDSLIYEHISDNVPEPFNSLLIIPVISSSGAKYTLISGNLISKKTITADVLKVLSIATKQIVTAIEKLEQEKLILLKNIDLEKKVRDRTSELEKSMVMINRQRDEIEVYTHELEEIIIQRTEKLVEAEKLASLGALVAGLAHEMNTPLGIIVTSNSHLIDEILTLKKMFQDNNLKKSDLKNIIDKILEMANITDNNSVRANDLISSFKQLSIDITNLNRSEINVKDYINKFLLILKPSFKEFNANIVVNCVADLKISSYPGLLSQILSNLILNSILHGFCGRDNGGIIIDVEKTQNILQIIYTDDGCGINKSIQSRIFEPFFTTKRNKGGTGLGLHIVYNIITQNLNGTITCDSIIDKGSRFLIKFPIETN